MVRALLLPLGRSWYNLVDSWSKEETCRRVVQSVGDMELDGNGNVRSLPTIACCILARGRRPLLSASGNSSHSWQGNRSRSARQDVTLLIGITGGPPANSAG